MDSSASISSSRKKQRNSIDEQRHPYCNCGMSEIRIAWTGDNPGRRFFGCSKYKVSEFVVVQEFMDLNLDFQYFNYVICGFLVISISFCL